MAQFGKTVLVAGLLAVAANSAFADNRQQHKNAPANEQKAQAFGQDDGPISAFTKDGKGLLIQITVPTLNKGNYSDAQFKQALRGGVMVAAMTTMSQYTEADIPKNIDKIQKQLGDAIGNMIPMGTMTSGKPDMAKPGVNYGAPTITRILDAKDNKVVVEQKAQPTTKPATTQPKPGA